MSIRVLIGDLFASSAQSIVNTINCKGVMGAGIALRCKQLYPEVYTDYATRCAAGQVSPGEPYLYRRQTAPWILNFPTKNHWRSPSKIAYITDGLAYLERQYRQWGITSLAFPALGCGNGGLDWKEIGPLMYNALARFDIPIEIYAPLGTPDRELEEAFLGSMSQKDFVQTTLWDEGNVPTVSRQKRRSRTKKEL